MADHFEFISQPGHSEWEINQAKASYQAQGKEFTLFCQGDNHSKALTRGPTKNRPAYSAAMGM